LAGATRQQSPNAFHPWFGMAADFAIISQNFVDEADFLLAAIFILCRCGGFLLQALAQASDFAFKLAQLIPVIGLCCFSHGR